MTKKEKSNTLRTLLRKRKNGRGLNKNTKGCSIDGPGYGLGNGKGNGMNRIG